MLNFRQNLYLEDHSFSDADKLPETGPGKVIGNLELRLSHALIKDNNTRAIPPYPGYAKLYFLGIVASSAAKNGFMLHLKSFDQVDDGDALNLEKILYRWQKGYPTEVAPAHLHVLTSLIKSKQPLRDVATILSDMYRDSSYKLLTATLDKLVKGATTLPDISNLMFNIAGIAGKYLGKTDDRPLLSWYQGFSDMSETPAVLGKTEKTAANQYVAIKLSLVAAEDKGQGVAAVETAKAEQAPLLFPFK